MNRSRRITHGYAGITVAVACLAWASASTAVEHHAGLTTWTESAWPPRAIVSGEFGLDGAHSSLTGSALGTGTDGLRSGHVDGALLLIPQSKRPLELRFEAARREALGEPSPMGARAEARLHVASAGSGAWVGLAEERGRGVTTQRLDGDGALLGLGIWASSHGTSLTLDLEQRGAYVARPKLHSVPRADSLSAPAVTTPAGGTLRGTLTIARARVRWEGERLALESTGGLTMSLVGSPRRWAQASARARLTPRVSAFATFGSRGRENYVVPLAEAPGTSVGIEFAQGRPDELRPLVERSSVSDWTARRVDAGTFVLGVRAPTARLVEIAGDFTNWEPIALERTGYERWQIVTALEPGIHHVSLRIDGGSWTPPPGIATTTDGYNGSSGLLVIE